MANEQENLSKRLTKSECMMAGHWPAYFLKDLISPVPDLSISAKTKLTWYYPVHGDYQQTIEQHLAGVGCRQYKLIQTYPPRHGWSKSRVLLEGRYPEEFLKNLIDEAPSLKAPSSFKLKWWCEIHGVYEHTIVGHLKNPKCPKCMVSEKAKAMARSKKVKHVITSSMRELFSKCLEREKLLHGDYSVKDLVHIECPVHGVYTQSIASLLKGSKCPKCSYEERAKNIRATKRKVNPFPEELLQDLKDKSLISKIQNGEVPVRTILTFVCPVHGDYHQRLFDHRAGCKCPKCHTWTSSLEDKLEHELIKCNVKVLRNVRNLVKAPSGRYFELDLYLPDYKVAVEVNGLYFHSIQYIESPESHAGYGKEYHKVKQEACANLGIRLIHLFEDSLQFDFEVCKSLILSKCGLLQRTKLYARALKVVDVDLHWLIHITFSIMVEVNA